MDAEGSCAQAPVLSGRDEMMIQALIAGIGFVGSQYNFAGDMYNAIIDAFKRATSKGARHAAGDDRPDRGVVGRGRQWVQNVLNVAPGGFA